MLWAGLLGQRRDFWEVGVTIKLETHWQCDWKGKLKSKTNMPLSRPITYNKAKWISKHLIEIVEEGVTSEVFLVIKAWYMASYYKYSFKMCIKCHCNSLYLVEGTCFNLVNVNIIIGGIHRDLSWFRCPLNLSVCFAYRVLSSSREFSYHGGFQELKYHDMERSDTVYSLATGWYR